jgi:hypothetical protein
MAAPAAPWLKGYARTISGETIDYHSPYPGLSSALLVRATDGTMRIAWETGPVPADFREKESTFIWMCGLATHDGGHEFKLAVDGRPVLAFRSAKDPSEKAWEVAGSGGARLAFRATMEDPFRELFGYMFLTLPAASVSPGKPARISVIGEKGDSPDWFMVFEQSLKPWVRAGAEEALVRKEGRLHQLIRVEISHMAPPARAVLSSPGGVAIEARLETGYNYLSLPVEAVAAETETQIFVQVDGPNVHQETVRLRPIVRRELWLLPHSHTDIGYSDHQEVVERNHWMYLEQAIELARRTADDPAGARFKWNSEVLWAVETYLRQASPEKKAVFLDAVKSGWIGLQATLANVLTGLCHPEELFHLADFARRLHRDEGFLLDTAMITDIPGATWSLVPALAQSGVKYFSSGPNYMPTLPDRGDRIGGALKAWGDKPFYWLGPSEQDRLLFWMAGRGYSWFHGLNLGNLGLDKARPVLDYCRELAEAAYPYEMVQVRYTVGGDNGPPDPNLPGVVRAWNEKYESPKLIIAAAGEMFREFERRHGNEIPSVRGDFASTWEDGAASTASELAANRRSANRLLQAETLWALIDSRYPAAEFEEAWRQVVLFDEHTWGAADSISRPDGANARRQWEYKEAIVREGEHRSRALLGRALASWNGKRQAGEKSPADAVDVLNPTGWTRTEVVDIPGEWSDGGDLVRDEKGNRVPSQRLASGDLAALVGPVPPFGFRRYTMAEGRPYVRTKASVAGTRCGNEFLAATIDEKSGALSSLIWKKGGEVDLVDRTAGPGLNEFLYVLGRDPREARGAAGASISVTEAGPLVAVLTAKSEAPGTRSLRREIRLTAASERLEILDVIDKMKIRDKESVHLAFPFRIPEGVVRLDLGWGLIRPGIDQIPGANKDFYCLQTAADISNEEYGVTWVTLDAPLVEVGGMTDERPVEKSVRAWKTTLAPSQKLFAYLMNNYWHTNYKADQEGPVSFRFVVQPHRGAEPAGIARRGIEAARPLLVVRASASDPPSGAGLTVSTPGVLVTSLKPSEDGRAVIARLYNASPRPEDVVLGGRLAAGNTVFRSGSFEDRREALSGPLRLHSFETTVVRIERR